LLQQTSTTSAQIQLVQKLEGKIDEHSVMPEPVPSPIKQTQSMTKVKSWEQHMDVLFQRLMVTSMHHDGDIR